MNVIDTIKCLLAVSLVVPAVSAWSVEAKYVLRHSYIATDLPTTATWGFGCPGLADIDNDGDLDFFTGVSYDNQYWFEYTGNRANWTRHTVGSYGGLSHLGGVVHDVDGDGWADYVVGGAWFRNTHSPRTQQFTKYTYDSSVTKGTHDMLVDDLDRDGQKDDVVAYWSDSQLVWYEIPSTPTGSWTRHTIAGPADCLGIHGGTFPKGSGDLDGDGDVDVVLNKYWFRNDGGGTSWTKFDLPFGRNGTYGDGDPYGYSSRAWVADLDGDGDSDMVQCDCDMGLGTAAWLENNGSGTFTKHELPRTAPGNRGSLHSLAVFDFNGDGLLDIVTADQEDPCSLEPPVSPRVYLWENTSGSWTEHVLADIALGLHDFCIGDVEGDGDLDIVAKVWNHHAWGRNANGDNEHVDLWENLSVVNLFNGKDLKGWTVEGGSWTVSGGVITCQQNPPGSGNGGLLKHEVAEFGDFEVDLDVWPDYGCDTGLYFRINGSGIGYQMTIDYQLDNPMGEVWGVGFGNWDRWAAGWDFVIQDATHIKNGQRGGPVGFTLAEWADIWNAGDWNHFKLKVGGNPMRMQVWVNGTKTYDFTDTEALAWDSGRFCLQVHQGSDEWPAGIVTKYRNLTVNTVGGVFSSTESVRSILSRHSALRRPLSTRSPSTSWAKISARRVSSQFEILWKTSALSAPPSVTRK